MTSNPSSVLFSKVRLINNANTAHTSCASWPQPTLKLKVCAGSLAHSGRQDVLALESWACSSALLNNGANSSFIILSCILCLGYLYDGFSFVLSYENPL